MVKRLAAGALREQSPRNVHHVRRTSVFISQWRAATTAKATREAFGGVFVAGDGFFAVDYAEPLTPTADVGRVGSTVREPARAGMVVPCPAGREINLKANCAAQTVRFDGLSSWTVSCLHSTPSDHCRGQRVYAADPCACLRVDTTAIEGSENRKLLMRETCRAG
jgi:hypothetical protein